MDLPVVASVDGEMGMATVLIVEDIRLLFDDSRFCWLNVTIQLVDQFKNKFAGLICRPQEFEDAREANRDPVFSVLHQHSGLK